MEELNPGISGFDGRDKLCQGFRTLINPNPIGIETGLSRQRKSQTDKSDAGQP
jgi:hypothetical protein